MTNESFPIRPIQAVMAGLLSPDPFHPCEPLIAIKTVVEEKPMTDTINLQELYDAGKLKPGDEFLTRDGSSVWFIGVAKKTKRTYPFIFDRDLDDCLSYGGWQPDGTYIKGETNSWDIIRRAPRKITVWANLYDDNNIGSLCTSKELADACKTSVSRRIGVLSGEIEVDEES